MFENNKKIIGLCLFLAALLQPAAHAGYFDATVNLNPGTPGQPVTDLSWKLEESQQWFQIDVVFTDGKTCEFSPGTYLVGLYFASPNQVWTGNLLDAAGNPIPDATLIGETPDTTDFLAAGVLDLSGQTGTTVFSGIRFVSQFPSSFYEFHWLSDRCTVGQTEISGNQPPVPNAGGPYEGVQNTAITFDASASDDPDGTITSHTWDFGDGTSPLGGETIPHTYASAGRYNVTLTVTDNDGASQSTSTLADIGNFSLRPTADAGGPYTGETLDNVQFDGTGSTDEDGAITQYTWDFGDGTAPISGTATPLKSYSAADTYYVVLTVTDDTGNTDATVTVATITAGNQAPVADAGPPAEGVVGTAVSFDGGGSSDDVGIVSYDWDFGDSNTGTGVNPSHTYTAPGDYTVILTVTDGDGVKDSGSTAASIDANPLPPRADAGAPAEGTAGVAVSFDGSGSGDSDGNIVTYAWDFGDGSLVDTVSGANPSHTYAAAGSYTVTLTVTDDDGLTGNDTTQAAIDQANSPPTADAGGPYAGIVNQPVILAGAESSDADGDIVQYDWDFDDGNTGSGLNVAHTYAASGVYEVTLTVTDNSGDTDASNAVVVVGGGAIQPPTVLTTGPYNGVVGVPLTVDGSNSSDPDGTINTYDWAFGDGNSDTGPMPANNYAASGFYAVTLQVTDDDGFTASGGTVVKIGNLSVPPNAVANDVPYQGRVGVPVAFDGGNSSDPDGTINRYDWEFGDGNVANDAGPITSNTYAASGVYFVKLTVTDDSGETDTTITSVTVGTGNLPPVADAGQIVSGTVGNSITFDGSGSSDSDGDIVEIKWDFGDGTDSGPLVPAASKVAAAGYRPAATTSENVVHTYDTPGTYFVVLTVTDNDGAVSSDVTVADVAASSSSGGDGGGSAFPGCSIVSGDTRDPTLLLLGLFAVLYLVRRRAGQGRR